MEIETDNKERSEQTLTEEKQGVQLQNTVQRKEHKTPKTNRNDWQ